MPLPASVVIPAASRDYLAVLEYRVDKTANKLRKALARIFAAQRPRLNFAPAWTAPTFEVIADYLPVPEPLQYRCKHGSQPGYVSQRLIGPLIREDNGRGTMVWTPEHGVTFFLRHLQGEADASYDYALRKFRTSTCVILPQRPVCEQCDAEHKDAERYLLVQFQSFVPFAYRVVSHGVSTTEVATIQDKGICDVYNFEKNSPVYRKPSPWINLSSNGVVRSGAMPRLLKHYCPNCTEITIDDSEQVCRFYIGCYLPKEHECPMARVYNLEGVLLETRSLLEARSPRPVKSAPRAKPVNRDEAREVAARKRLTTEMRMVATRHPNAPYEARSFNEIMRESRTFPT